MKRFLRCFYVGVKKTSAAYAQRKEGPIELELELELELETGNIGGGVPYSGRRDWSMNADPPPKTFALPQI